MKKQRKRTSSNSTRIDRHHKRKRNYKPLLIIVALLLLGAAAYGTKIFVDAKSAVDNSFKELKQTKNTITKDGKEISVEPIDGVISLLVMGLDDDSIRQLGSARTDALLYLTIDTTKHDINMVSIPRDTYTDIFSDDFYGKDKINAAYTYGQEEASIDAVENLLNVPINHYISFNFQSFLGIVDALGGIDVDVPISFTDTNTQGNGEVTLTEGRQHLNGEQALALARTRHSDNDIKRGERQQLVIKAIADKATSVGSLSKYSEIIKAVGSNMQTNLTFDEMLALAQSGVKDSYDFNSYLFDWQSFDLDGASMVELFPDSVEYISHRFRVSLGLDTEDDRDAADYQFQTNGLGYYQGN
ncbi:LCP family protein [Vagococcus sp. BWB3-3]|uniref:LCP family protein n=1 Tax=Vagococcus allomyrinae TaxID=2794353 RepID=A0A940P9M0_9ENTE|nr:LCP family protein [Vagococcus allomyrinae]MBP1044299.1 LCP family protein [Vagococcus allomyrinae]